MSEIVQRSQNTWLRLVVRDDGDRLLPVLSKLDKITQAIMNKAVTVHFEHSPFRPLIEAEIDNLPRAAVCRASVNLRQSHLRRIGFLAFL